MLEKNVDIERKIDSFGVQTINDVEKKSKTLLATVGKINNTSNMRRWN